MEISVEGALSYPTNSQTLHWKDQENKNNPDPNITGRGQPVGRGFELRAKENKSSKWPERVSNASSPDCESDTHTTRPR